MQTQVLKCNICRITNPLVVPLRFLFGHARLQPQNTACYIHCCRCRKLWKQQCHVCSAESSPATMRGIKLCCLIAAHSLHCDYCDIAETCRHAQCNITLMHTSSIRTALLFSSVCRFVQGMLLGYYKQRFASSIFNPIWSVLDCRPDPGFAPFYGI